MRNDMRQATDVFGEWAEKGRDIGMAKGHAVSVSEMLSFDDFAAIKLVVESSGAVKNLTILEAIDFGKATAKASKIGYKAPGQ